MTLAQQIMIARKNLGITQNELSIRLGMTKNQISNIERGLSNPKINTLEKIAKELSVSFIIA